MRLTAFQLGISATVGVGLVLATSSFGQTAPSELPTIAQTPTYANCQPPSLGEYLLLVMSQTPESQAQVKRSLPPNAPTVVCRYLNDIVTRVSGFKSLDTANAWAKYLTESAKLPTFVARPPEAAAPVPTVPAPIVPSLPAPIRPGAPTGTSTPSFPSPIPAATPTDPAFVSPGNNPGGTSAPAIAATLPYKPQPLGPGYAVLVDYFNQPEVAAQVQMALGRNVGLVSYGQRPYVLAAYTADQSTANSTLQALSNSGFWAVVVDSRRVVLLRSVISLSAGRDR